MSSLLETLCGQLGGDNLRQLSQALGTDEKQTGEAVSAALPTLLGALARNASTESGAESLSGALQKDHDGSALQNLAGLFGGGSSGGGAQSGAGAGILRHVLGGRQPRVEQGISKASGMDTAQVGQLMTMLAPIVMAQLGKQQREKNLDSHGLASLLGQERQSLEKAPEAAGLLGSLLDADGDGDVDMSDIAKQGVGMLGKFLRGK